MYWGYHYWGMHLFWWLFWVGIVVLLVSTGWPRSRIGAHDPALDALRTRYAAGEIDEEEYQERLLVLTGRHAAPGRPGRPGRPGSPGSHDRPDLTRLDAPQDRTGPADAGRAGDGRDARG